MTAECRMEICAANSLYIAWKCGGRCSSRYIRIEIPRKRLISGMDSLRVLIQQRLRFLAGHLQPERIGAEIKLVVPDQFAQITNARLAKIFVAVPKGKNAGAGF